MPTWSVAVRFHFEGSEGRHAAWYAAEYIARRMGERAKDIAVRSITEGIADIELVEWRRINDNDSHRIQPRLPRPPWLRQ